MPTVFRAMKRDPEGLPECGNSSKQLGVRVPPNKHADVDLKDCGNVKMNEKGLSVGSHWTKLPPHLIPKRLFGKRPGAVGSDKNSCFKLGAGSFDEGDVSENLTLVKKSVPSLGLIIPQTSMHIDEYQEAIAATRCDWIIDEEAEQ